MVAISRNCENHHDKINNDGWSCINRACDFTNKVAKAARRSRIAAVVGGGSRSTDTTGIEPRMKLTNGALLAISGSSELHEAENSVASETGFEEIELLRESLTRRASLL